MAKKQVLENRKKTMPVADILRIAADNYLRTGPEYENFIFSRNGKEIQTFSCIAVRLAIKEKIRPDVKQYNIWITKQGKTVQKFLKDLGVDTTSMTLFYGFNRRQAQDTRYAWLNFAADIAEEEGLMC
jgi:hypothetical protein